MLQRRQSVALALTLASARAGAQSANDTPPSAPAAVTVTGHRAGQETTGTEITPEEGARLPGTQGDPLKAVQALPGVTRPSFGLGPLIVWGAAPRDTHVYVDGVEVPALYHGGGIRSTIGSGFVGGVTLVPGAYGAAYGGGLGGIVQVTTRPLPEEGTHGFAAADFLDASAMASVAVGKSVRAAVAGRYGYVDKVLSAAGFLDDLGSYASIPRYDDAQAKMSWKLGEREQLSAVFLHSRDAVRHDVPYAGPGGSSRETFDSSFQRFYFTYVRLPDARTRVSVTPYYGFDHDRRTTVFQNAPTHLGVDAVRYGLRATRDERFGSHLWLSAGADVDGTRSSLSRAGSLTLPAREGDVTVFGQPPGADVNSDLWQTHVVGVAPYAIARLTFDPIVVTPGIRLDGYFVQTSRENPPVGATPKVGVADLAAAIEPRLSVDLRAAERVSFTAAAGVYHAPPAPEDLGAVFGTPALTLSSARHLSLGQVFALTQTTRIEVVEYAEWLSRLAVRTRREAPALARALVQDGEGRNYGVEVIVRQELSNGLSGWAAYTLSRSERRYVGDDEYRLFDYDRMHVLTVAAAQDVSRWTFGVKVQYATGLPRTPVTGAYFNATSGRDEPFFGPQNSTRLPAFFELDLRIDRRFPLSEEVELRLYAEADNVTGRRNAEEIVYNSQYTKRNYITGLPPIAMLGARIDFQ